MLLLDCLMMRHDAAAPREYAPSRVARRCLLELGPDAHRAGAKVKLYYTVRHSKYTHSKYTHSKCTHSKCAP